MRRRSDAESVVCCRLGDGAGWLGCRALFILYLLIFFAVEVVPFFWSMGDYKPAILIAILVSVTGGFVLAAITAT